MTRVMLLVHTMVYATCMLYGECQVASCMVYATWYVHGVLYGVCQVNENCDLKICDFGLARMSEIPEKAMLMTCYVVTRW